MSALARRLSALLADTNPILLKELRATFRTTLFVRFLYLLTGVVAMAVLALGAAIASNDLPPATVGQVVLQVFLGAGLFVIFLVAPGPASASITSEHEQQTWESLELSGMSAWRIVWGKLAACYASFALVLVALSPIVGIAFLFGGVSPGQVLVGFASLLVALVPAVAWGLAISARLRSTRLAIVLATASFFPIGLFAVAMVTILGQELCPAWGVAMSGPFFYTEAFVTRAGELDTWTILFVLPLWAIGMLVWFLLATAVAAVRPAAEDRARPMKLWAIAMSLSSVAAVVIAVVESPTPRDADDASVLACMILVGLLVVYGVLFTNEPPLPPRSWERARARLPAWRRALGALGPGAAGTMRFSIALSLATAALVPGAALLARHLLGSHSWRHDFACLALAVGGFALAAFAAALGAYLRLVLANGLASRVLALSILLGAAVLPFLGSLLIDPSSLDRLDVRSPLVIAASSLEPFLFAVQVLDRDPPLVPWWHVAITPALYGGVALVLAVLVELRVARARRERAARRARFEEPA